MLRLSKTARFALGAFVIAVLGFVYVPLLLVVVAPAESLPRVPSSPQAPMLAPINIHTGARAPTRPIRPIRFISPGDHIGRGTGRARARPNAQARAHARQGARNRDADCSEARALHERARLTARAWRRRR